jgi:hypothetical protein
VVLLLHIDEIYQKNAAQTAQPHLPCDFMAGFLVQGKNRIFKKLFSRIFACVHIDHGHGLAQVKYEVSAAFEPDPVFERSHNLGMDAKDVKQISIRIIKNLNTGNRETLYIGNDSADLTGRIVPHNFSKRIRVLV